MLKKAESLEVGESLQWENAPLSCSMIADYLNVAGRQFAVRWICTNWEASLGYVLISRCA